jgi:hypothetical protein
VRRFGRFVTQSWLGEAADMGMAGSTGAFLIKLGYRLSIQSWIEVGHRVNRRVRQCRELSEPRNKTESHAHGRTRPMRSNPLHHRNCERDNFDSRYRRKISSKSWHLSAVGSFFRCRDFVSRLYLNSSMCFKENNLIIHVHICTDLIC